MSLKIRPAFLALVALYFFSPPLWAEDIAIYFKASPRLELLHPYSDPATLTLLVTGADGKPVAQGRVLIGIEAPEPGWFFSTDFPLVEGSGLLSMSLPLRQGRTEWKYLFPIRGQYRLAVEFISVDGRRVNQIFPLVIRENKDKWFLLGIFTMGLFVLGVIAGRIFSAGLADGKGRAALFFLIVVYCLAAPTAVVPQEPEQRKISGLLEIAPATVGQSTTIRWRLTGEENVESRAVLLSLTIVHLEKAKTVFSVEKLSLEGAFGMGFQFTDGAEYRVTAIGYLPGGQAIRTERNISVVGVEPPARAMIPAIGFFLGVIALGLGVGRWSRRAAPS